MMNSHHHTKLVHEGRYAAEIEVDLIDTDTGWSCYLSLSDTQKLDEGRTKGSGVVGLRPVVRRIRFPSQSEAESERGSAWYSHMLLGLSHQRYPPSAGGFAGPVFGTKGCNSQSATATPAARVSRDAMPVSLHIR